MNLRLSIILFMALSSSACQHNGTKPTEISEKVGDIFKPIKELINKNKGNSTVVVLNDCKKIKALQRLLNQEGYNTKGIDCNVGPATKLAIRSYQRQHSLAVNGEASVALLGHIQNTDQTTIENHSIGDNDFKIEQCVSSSNSDLKGMVAILFESVLDDLQIDPASYLKGFCLPTDKNKLARLYIFLVTEGVLHSRIAEIKYNELLAVYEKAGIDIAFIKNSISQSTGDKLVKDIQVLANDRMDGATTLVSNSSQPEDNADFQLTIQEAYAKLNPNSRYKKQARHLLSEVLVHSSSSTFYLARSAYTISELSNYFGINLGDGISFAEKLEIVFNQISENFNLGVFLVSKQSDLMAMLVSSSYSIKGLTQDVRDIPKPDAKVATREAREYKKKGGFTLDEMEIDFAKDNRQVGITRS